MKRTGIFYGSTTGTTREVAQEIAQALGVVAADVHDVAESAPSDVAPYDVLVLGSSTWGDGDLQDDWYDFADGLQAVDLKGKKIALFGCGDENMSETFCNAVGDLYDRLKDTGAEFIGAFPVDGYDFHHTNALRDGKIIGLLIDNVNHPEMTASRIKSWAAEVKSEE